MQAPGELSEVKARILHLDPWQITTTNKSTFLSSSAHTETNSHSPLRKHVIFKSRQWNKQNKQKHISRSDPARVPHQSNHGSAQGLRSVCQATVSNGTVVYCWPFPWGGLWPNVSEVPTDTHSPVNLPASTAPNLCFVLLACLEDGHNSRRFLVGSCFDITRHIFSLINYSTKNGFSNKCSTF